MSVSAFTFSKLMIPHLVDMPRDFFWTQEYSDPGALPAIDRFFTTVENDGIGLDLIILNQAVAAGDATITVDKRQALTLAPGARFAMNNILFTEIDVQRAGVGAIHVDLYWAGCTRDLLELIAKMKNIKLKF